MPEILNKRWVRASLVAGALVFAFCAGAIGLWTAQNRDRIQARLFPDAPAPLEDTIVYEWSRIETGLQTIYRSEIELVNLDIHSSGGALDSVGDTILYVSASGFIGTVDLQSGQIAYSDVRVPMDYDHLQADVFPEHIQFNRDWYRVQDIMIRRTEDPAQAILYVSHHVFVPESKQICTVISHTGLDLSDGGIRLTDGIWQELYRMPDCVNMEDTNWSYYGLESGGRMLMLDDTHLLMGVGDYGLRWDLNITGRVGAEFDNHFAKMMSIDLTSGEATVYANGVRNPQGLTRDSDGNIWETEHGPQGGDEINLIRQGAHYGWPIVSLGMNYGSPRKPITTNPVQGRHDGYDRPAMAFLPSIAISAIASVPDSPEAFDLWSGDLLVASLKARSLYHLRRDGIDLLYAEPIDLGARLRDIHILDNGWVALLTDYKKTIILLRDTPGPGMPALPPLTISGYDGVNDTRATYVKTVGEQDYGEWLFHWKCSSCHTLAGDPMIGPPLKGVVGRQVGSVENYTYSEDLEKAQNKWTRKKLEAFIQNPQAVYPGSAMPPQVLESYEKRALIKYLSNQTD